MGIIVLILQKFLKNEGRKHRYYLSAILTVAMVFIIIGFTFLSDIGRYHDFNTTMVTVKTIDIGHVFVSNVTLIALNLLFGTITFGGYTIFSILQNVHSLAVIANVLHRNKQTHLLFRLLPHGVIELFVLNMTLLVGMHFTVCLFKLSRDIVQRKSGIRMRATEYFKWGFRDAIVLCVLLFFAAIVEFFVSVFL